jgi:GTP-binding protein EngB required for normal cell division
VSIARDQERVPSGNGVPLPSFDTPLADAVRRAAEESREQLAGVVAEFARALRQAEAVAREEKAWVLSLESRFRAEVERHERDASQFRIVLFGRTGTGKSSLIEAISRGDGASISTGESDFTLEPREVPWGALTLVDTPGIGGWGLREVPVAQLEAIASKEVRRADLVILACDRDSQQAEELALIGREVAQHNRPVLVVFNAKNHRWRQPPQAASRLESTRYLRRELEAAGISVPLVAVNAFQAEQSRCRRGSSATPGGDTNGAGDSNLELLEAVIGHALLQGSTTLRLQSVRENLRGLLRSHSDEMADEAASTLSAAEEAERRIGRFLELVGDGLRSDIHPGRWDRRRLGRSRDRDPLTRLEERRGARLWAGPGQLLDTAQAIQRATLQPARRAMLQAAEELVVDCIKRREQLTDAMLKKRLVQHRKRLEAAGRLALDEFRNEAERCLQGLDLEIRIERELLLGGWQLGSVRTSKSPLAQRLAISAEVGTSIGIAIALIAGGPVGWIAAGAMAVAGALTGWTRRRVVRSHEKKLAAIQAQAIASLRQEVSQRLDAFEAAYWRAIEQALLQVAKQVIPPLAKTALRDRIRADCLRDSAAVILDSTSVREPVFAAAAVLTSAIGSVAKEVGVSGRREVESLLLGTTRLGARAVEQASSAVADEAVGERWARLAGRLTVPAPVSEALRSSTLEQRISTASLPRRTRQRLLRSRHPGVVVAAVAPYDKVLTRTMRQLTRRLAESLDGESAHPPVTVVTVDWAESDRWHDVATAHAVLWFVPPNAVPVRSPLFWVLSSLPPSVISLLWERSGVVLLGVEGLGADPDTDAEGFAALLARKSLELHEGLAEHGVEHPPDHMAAFPRDCAGLDLGPALPGWTGFDAAVEAVRRLGGLFADPLHRERDLMVGVAAEISRSEARLVVADDRNTTLEHSCRLVRQQRRRGERLLDDAEMRLTEALSDRVAFLASDLFAHAGDALRQRQKNFERWADDAVVKREIEAWQESFRQTWVRWERETAEVLEVGEAETEDGILVSPEYRLPGTRSVRGGRAVKTVATALSKASVTRDAWYETVKAVTFETYKFKPWGAIKGAAAASRVASVLGAVGAVLTVGENVLEAHNRRVRQNARNNAILAARGLAEEAVRTYLHGTGSPAEAGFFSPCQRQMQALLDHESELMAEAHRSGRTWQAQQKEFGTLQELQKSFEEE